MWINREAYRALTKAVDGERERLTKLLADLANTLGVSSRLEIENTRLRADMEWFKHRLNQVERERGQMLQAQLGIKIAVPEFVPTYEDPGSALNDMPNLSTVGDDAAPEAEPADGVDYSLMPGYRKGAR